MKDRKLALALQIAQMLSENTEAELQGAVELLRKHGVTSSLLSMLVPDSSLSEVKRQAPQRGGSASRKPVKKSKKLAELEVADPEKARLIGAFEDALRAGKVLKSFEDIKRFSGMVSKDFRVRKSRKETISPLIAELATKNLSEIEEAIQQASHVDVESNGEGYQNLAHYLIRGRT